MPLSAESIDESSSGSSDGVLALVADHSEGDFNGDGEGEEAADSSDSLPGYLLGSIARLELLSLTDVEEEINEVGDGGASDVEGDDLEEHDNAMNAAITERLVTTADDDGKEVIDDSDRNSFLLKK